MKFQILLVALLMGGCAQQPKEMHVQSFLSPQQGMYGIFSGTLSPEGIWELLTCQTTSTLCKGVSINIKYNLFTNKCTATPDAELIEVPKHRDAQGNLTGQPVEVNWKLVKKSLIDPYEYRFKSRDAIKLSTVKNGSTPPPQDEFQYQGSPDAADPASISVISINRGAINNPYYYSMVIEAWYNGVYQNRTCDFDPRIVNRG